MSALLVGSAIVTTTMIPAHGAAGGRPGRRARAGVPRASRSRRQVRHALRPGDDRHAVVRRARRRWPGCSTSSRSTCRATAWRRTGRARRARSSWSSRRSAIVVTIVFDANVNSQGGAYATGVLMLMTSAAVAVAIAIPERRRYFVPISCVFVYTTAREHRRTARRHQDRRLVHRRDRRVVAGLARAAIDRDPHRGRRLRRHRARAFIREAAGRKSLRIIASRPNTGEPRGVRAQVAGGAALAPPAAG